MARDKTYTQKSSPGCQRELSNKEGVMVRETHCCGNTSLRFVVSKHEPTQGAVFSVTYKGKEWRKLRCELTFRHLEGLQGVGF